VGEALSLTASLLTLLHTRTETMKVTLTSSIAGERFQHAAGDVVEVDDVAGERMLNAGLALPYDPKAGLQPRTIPASVAPLPVDPSTGRKTITVQGTRPRGRPRKDAAPVAPVKEAPADLEPVAAS
jgi:hypothetical protein